MNYSNEADTYYQPPNSDSKPALNPVKTAILIGTSVLSLEAVLIFLAWRHWTKRRRQAMGHRPPGDQTARLNSSSASTMASEAPPAYEAVARHDNAGGSTSPAAIALYSQPPTYTGPISKPDDRIAILRLQREDAGHRIREVEEEEDRLHKQIESPESSRGP